VTCSALVSGFITSPAGALSSVNVSTLRLREGLPHPAPREQQQPIRFINRGAAQRWLALTTQRSVCPLPLAPLLFLLRRSALNSTLFKLRDLLSAVIIARHNESIMKFVANYFNNRFLSILSIRCCSPNSIYIFIDLYCDVIQTCHWKYVVDFIVLPQSEVSE